MQQVHYDLVFAPKMQLSEDFQKASEGTSGGASDLHTFCERWALTLLVVMIHTLIITLTVTGIVLLIPTVVSLIGTVMTLIAAGLVPTLCILPLLPKEHRTTGQLCGWKIFNLKYRKWNYFYLSTASDLIRLKLGSENESQMSYNLHNQNV